MAQSGILSISISSFILLFVPTIFCYDVVLWGNDHNRLEGQNTMKSIIENASTDAKLLLISVANFNLASFSHYADAYGNKEDDDLSEKTLLNAIKTSGDSAAEWFEDGVDKTDEMLPFNKDVSSSEINSASIILVDATSLEEADALATVLLPKLSSGAYVSVLTSPAVFDTAKQRLKRSNFDDLKVDPQKDDKPPVKDDVDRGNAKQQMAAGDVGCKIEVDAAKYYTAAKAAGSSETKLMIDTLKIGTAVCSQTDKTDPEANTTFTITTTPQNSIAAVTVELICRGYQNGYWQLWNVKVNGKLAYTQDNIQNLPNWWSVKTFNYACRDTPVIWTAEFGIAFSKLQIQPFGVENNSFSAMSEDCEPLLSIAVWMGLLSGGILLAVLFFGFGMVSSINTMDRFDDPKQKLIQLGTRE